MKKATVHIAGGYPVKRVIRDIARNTSGGRNPLGFTHTALVKYGGNAVLVCAASEHADWYDMNIPEPQLKQYLLQKDMEVQG